MLRRGPPRSPTSSQGPARDQLYNNSLVSDVSKHKSVHSARLTEARRRVCLEGLPCATRDDESRAEQWEAVAQ